MGDELRIFDTNDWWVIVYQDADGHRGEWDRCISEATARTRLRIARTYVVPGRTFECHKVAVRYETTKLDW